jgi:acyl-CoA thioesterase-1
MQTAQVEPNGGRSLLLVTLGTSLTARGDRSPVVEALEISRESSVRFVNAGRGGANSRYGVSAAVDLADLRPDYIVIEFAANDADIRSLMSLSESARNLRAIVRTFRAKSPDVLIANA